MPKPSCLLTAIAIAILPPLGAAFATEPAKVGSACRIVVTKDQISATFPAFKVPTIWRWNRSTTDDNELEYRWMVEFGSCDDHGAFIRQKHAFAVQLFKFPGGIERSGTFSDLLSAAQADELERTNSPQGTKSYVRLKGFNASGDVRPGAIEIGVRSTALIQTLTTGKPTSAQLTVNRPDPGQSYTCTAEIEYR